MPSQSYIHCQTPPAGSTVNSPPLTNGRMKQRICAIQLATIIPQFQREPPHASNNTSCRRRKLSSSIISATSKPVTAKTCGKCTHQRRQSKRAVVEDPQRNESTDGKLNSHKSTMWSYSFTSNRFHVLLNSLFKVLFNFPSRYLSTIGLRSVFSLKWSLPPTLGCIPKQPDSKDNSNRKALASVEALHPLWDSPNQEDSDAIAMQRRTS